MLLDHDFLFKFIPGWRNSWIPFVLHLLWVFYLALPIYKAKWLQLNGKTLQFLKKSLFQDAVAGRVNIRWTSYAITVRGLLVDITEWWPAYPYEFIMPIDNKILKTIAWGQPYSFSMCHNIYGVTCLWCIGTGLVIN